MSATWTRTAVRLGIMILLIVACICVGILLPSILRADDAPWRGEYFNNQNLMGSPAAVRYDAALNFDWQDDAPVEGVGPDYFSVRWTANMYFEGGRYSFKTYTDDGVRLWVDGTLLIDQWRNQSVTLNELLVDVSAGVHSVRVEYYENFGNAVAMAWWDRVTPTSGIWRAEYFNNPVLFGAPVLTRDEAELNQNWGAGAPVGGVGADAFSARWTGTFGFEYAGNYIFNVTADDGVRVWVDGGLLINEWRDQSASFAVRRYVAQGSHPITVEYYEAGGYANIHVWWYLEGSPVPTVTPVPGSEVIVDDLSSGFQKAGPGSSWWERAIGYANHIWWTYNSATQVYNYAKWVPVLPKAGNYEVYAFIPKSRADTQSARYHIYHGGQDHSFVMNQSLYFDKWVCLGTYYFAATGGEYVYLDDMTGEPYASRKVGFDAVKFVPKDGVAPPPAVPTAVPPTPVPPTPVPPTPVVPTPVPPTPVVPTPVAPACPITPILGFGQVWSTHAEVRNRLGCPVEVEKSTWSAEQTFVNGYMFWRGDLTTIYTLFSDGKFQTFLDSWTSAEPEWDPTIVPPAGYYQPKRGFGKVWREGVVPPSTPVRTKLSWATAEERGLSMSWQVYAGGMMVWSNTLGNFVLYYDNYTWQHYD